MLRSEQTSCDGDYLQSPENPAYTSEADLKNYAASGVETAANQQNNQSAQQNSNGAAQQQVTAQAKGTSVTYTYPDGSTIAIKGTHPFRDNNPGNEISGPGVIGKDKGFVIFATAEDGWNALAANLQGHMNDTILATITARTPKDDGKNPMLKGNDPVA